VAHADFAAWASEHVLREGGGQGSVAAIKLLASAGSIPHDSIPYNPSPPRPRHALQ